MIKDICASVYQNKNILMLITVSIYILALFGTLSGITIFFALVLTAGFIFAAVKDLFPIKIIIIWAMVFYFGVINTSIRLRETDELIDIAPVNSIIYGKIVSVPKTKDDNKVQFFFKVNTIEYDGITKIFNKKTDNEILLVTLNSNEKFRIYDSYKIRGRLSVPFKAGNPSQFDYGNYLRNYKTYAVFYGRNPFSMKDLDVPCYEHTENKNSRLEKILQKISNYRENILQVHSNYLASPNLEILGGIVFGDDVVSPPENIKQSFVNSGLLHILAASGMNVAFIYGFFFLILNFLRIPYKFNIGICILAVITYVFMTGLGASVLRAALMLLFVLVGKLINRDAHSIALLSFVAFLMLIYNPMYINDVGFQLSFIVTFGLLIMTPYLVKSKYKIVNSIIGAIFIPIIAQLWVIPIQIFYFNNISFYAVFANIMSVPILSAVSFCGFISSLISIISPISHLVCHAFDVVINPLISLLINISDFWGNLPHSIIQTTHPNPVQIILYYLILLNITAFWNKDYREKYFHIMKISLPSLVVILLITTIHLPNHNMEITAFDVGNADAFMIKTPENKYFMIDTGKSGYNGGKSQAELLILKYFKDNGIKNLESIIITHFDNDHSGGSVDLIDNMKIKSIFVNSKNHSSNSAKAIYKTANEHGVNIIMAENNQIVYSDKNLKITNFIANDVSGVGDNESSIITLVKYGDFTMLFTGDAGIQTFDKLKSYIPRNIEILKVGHHGAPGVINNEMVNYLSPKYSIVSTGENKFGHPSIYTIGCLNKSKVLRTDVNNSIKIVIAPEGYQVLTYNPIRKKYTK